MLGTTGILFEPKTEWQGSTRYSFQFPLPETTTDQEPATSYEYWFETPQIKITNIQQEHLIHQNPLLVSFSQEISLEEAAKIYVEPETKFELKYHQEEKENKKGELETIIDQKTIEFHPLENWKHNTNYQLTLPAETHSQHGNIARQNKQIETFHTLNSLKVNKIEVPKNIYGSAIIEFTNPINKDTFFDNLTITTPASEAANEYLKKTKENHYNRPEGSTRFFLPQPEGGWQAETQYEFLISQNLTDIYNQKLGQDNKIAFTTKFPGRIAPVYFPRSWKAYRHETTPTFSVWHTGDVRDITLKIKQVFPKEETITHNLAWTSDPLKRTIKEFDFTQLAPEFIDPEGQLEAGVYEMTLTYTDFNNAYNTQTLHNNFVITDFPVEISHQKTETSLIHALPFPGEEMDFSGEKTITLLNNYRNNGWSKYITKEKTGNPISSAIAGNSLAVVEINGLIGIGSSMFLDGITPYDAPISYNPYFYDYAANSASTTFLDRPLFKPGDRVFFKSFYRLLNFEEKESVIQAMQDGIDIKGYVHITGPQGRGNELHKEEIIFSNGSTDGYWDIPQDALLGQYNISITFFPFAPINQETEEKNDDPYDNPAIENVNINRNGTRHTNNQTFYVTEYRKPDFLINTSFDTETAIWKDQINAEISAEYAFGGGLAGKEVDYNISLFGHPKTQWWWENSGKRDKLIIQGKEKLDQYGKLQIPLNLDFEWDEDIEWTLLTLQTTVHSSQMDASSQTTSIPFSKANRKIELNTTRSFFQRSETDEVTITGTVSDINGQKLKGSTLTSTLERVKWIRNDRKGGDGNFVGEWRKSTEPINTKTFLSKDNGQFSRTITLPKTGGEYQITISTTDKQDRTTSQTRSFWIWSTTDSPFTVRGNDTNHILPLYRDKDKYLVGETAEILFPFNEWKITRAHATLQRGEILEELDIDLTKQQISIPIKKWMNPNVFVSLLIEGINPDGEPEIRWGAIELDVDDPANILDITITPEKEQYKPQDTVKLKIQTNVQGQGKTSEVTIAVVDETLLALKARPALDLWRKFFGNVPLGVYTTHTLANFVSTKALQDIYAQVEKIKDIGSDAFGGGGGGGGKGDTFKPRGDFRDTAEFIATAQTDTNGFAEIEFRLPDNLTTWNIWAVGTTLDNAFGETETQIQTTLPILISPIAPNFFRAGDQTQIGLLIKNNTKQKEDVTIKLQLPQELQTDSTEKEITVKNEERVYFDITVPYNKNEFPIDGIERDFSLQIETPSGLQDAVQLTRRILPPITEISAAEFLTVTEPTTIEIKTDERSLQSILKLNVFRTLLDRVSTFVGLAQSNNYNCIEQRFTYWTTRLLERDIQKQLGKRETQIPDQQLKKIIEDMIQIQQGGFRFWAKSPQPSPWLTAHILDFAPIWAKNGTPIPATNLNEAQNWLKNEIIGTCEPRTGRHCMGEATRQYAAHILLREGIIPKEDFEFLMRYTTQVESKVWYLRSIDQFSPLEISSKIREKRNTLHEEIKQLLRARDRYVFWTESEQNRNFYSQDQRITAIVLEYLMQQEELETYYPKIIRFLAEAKNISGNTALVTLRALINYATKYETAPDTNIDYSITETNEKEFVFEGSLETPQTEKETFETELEEDQDFALRFQSDNNEQYYTDIELQEIFEAKDLAPIAKGFWIERNFYDINDIYYETPLTEMTSGKHYRVRIRVATNTNHRQVLVEDAVITGAEGIDFYLDNVDTTINEKTEEEPTPYWRWHPPFITHQEFYHDKTRFFIPEMNAGIHDFEYIVRARIPGEYEQMPPKVKEMYYPEVFATGQGARIEIKK